MYKHNSRFHQSMKNKGRRLSGYPKSRKLVATQSSVTAEQQFETGTAYIKQLSPLVDQLTRARGSARKAFTWSLGHPGRTGYCESFNGRLRDECPNGEIFYSPKEAQMVIENWRIHGNTRRPHSSLGYRPPAPLTIAPPAPPLDATSNMH